MIGEMSQDASDDTSLLKAIDDEVHGLRQVRREALA